MKRIIPVVVFLCLFSQLKARGGGDAFVGGMAGGMMGGVISGAMTKSSDSGGGARDDVARLENAVKIDLINLSRDVNELRTQFAEMKSDVKELKKEIEKRESESDETESEE